LFCFIEYISVSIDTMSVTTAPPALPQAASHPYDQYPPHKPREDE
jgi:hypothetical protein